MHGRGNKNMNFKDFTSVGLSAEKKQLIRYKQAIKSLPQGSLAKRIKRDGNNIILLYRTHIKTNMQIGKCC